MWSRSAAAGLLLGLASLGSAQYPGTYSRAIPPDASALAKLNLRTEWSAYLPVGAGRDVIQLVQTVGDQLFVQTKTGQLIAVDARSGRIQWTAALGNGGYTNIFPVAANERFVFATNVTRVFAFHRDTGVVEFNMDLGTTPVTGLTADARGLYAALATQPGASGAHRVLAFDLPNPIALPDTSKGREAKAGEGVGRVENPVDQLTTRYPAPGVVRAPTVDTFERSNGAGLDRAPQAAGGGNRTPSLAALPRVSPPYTMEGQQSVPSLQIVPSLRQPYRLHDSAGRDLQKTPSLGTIPPSVAAALALTDLRPKEIRPRERWEYGLTTHIRFAPVLTPTRAWIVTDARSVIALSKADRTVEVDGPVWDQIAAQPGQAGTIAYVPLSDGSLLAVDLEGGNRISGLGLTWRSNIGGVLNHAPLVTRDAVFASGDRSGVVRVDRATGGVVWRTDRMADRLLAVNQDFAYVKEKQGKLLVFDVRRPTEPQTGRAAPLTSLDLPEFNIPVVNTVSDRLFLAADNGLIVCLRDASPKYEQPVRMHPGVRVDPVQVPRGGAAPPAGMPPAPPKN
ncbi:MAG TPA: PQQ-binding-like beta-propeller repeat protein [Urbifossiella sp.]|nr:PQQ-binding-like beta-propeller repeat protein [Urbifossiella sp.]